jgi:hypothetical protein
MLARTLMTLAGILAQHRASLLRFAAHTVCDDTTIVPCLCQTCVLCYSPLYQPHAPCSGCAWGICVSGHIRGAAMSSKLDRIIQMDALIL